MSQKDDRWEYRESVGGSHLSSSKGIRLAPGAMVAALSFSV